MNYTEFNDCVFKISGATRIQSKRIVDQTFAMIQESLEHGEPIIIKGFGKFESKVVPAHKARNPKTNKYEVNVPAKKKVLFKPSKNFFKEEVK